MNTPTIYLTELQTGTELKRLVFCDRDLATTFMSEHMNDPWRLRELPLLTNDDPDVVSRYKARVQAARALQEKKVTDINLKGKPKTGNPCAPSLPVVELYTRRVRCVGSGAVFKNVYQLASRLRMDVSTCIDRIQHGKAIRNYRYEYL